MEALTPDLLALRAPFRLGGDGAELAYGIAGESGVPVLLLMGYGMPGVAWRMQIGGLRTRYRVAYLDNRGAGQSRSAPRGYSIARFADDARRLLDHIGWDRAHVVGVSMGGMIAQELALRHRSRLRSLTLIATHAGGFFARLPSPRGLLYFARALIGPRRGRFDALRRLLFPADYLRRCDPKAMEALLQADFSFPQPLAQRAAQLRALLHHDSRRRLHRLAGLPTLIVQPQRDLLISPRQSVRLAAAIPGARLVSFDDAGHGLIRQCHRQLNRSLDAHFRAADATKITFRASYA